MIFQILDPPVPSYRSNRRYSTLDVYPSASCVAAAKVKPKARLGRLWINHLRNQAPSPSGKSISVSLCDPCAISVPLW